MTRHTLRAGRLVLLGGGVAIATGIIVGAFFWRASDSVARPATLRDLTVSDFFVPEAIGHVAERHVPPAPVKSKSTVVLIQDAHADPEAQRHVAQILRRLVAEFGVRLVLVEGGEGDIGLDRVRGFGSRAARRQLADEYLEAGVLSGEEYVALVEDHPLTLWGIDDTMRYKQHMASFLEIERLREAWDGPLQELERVAEASVQQSGSASLQHLLSRHQQFDAGEVSLVEYLSALLEEGAARGVDQAPYAQLRALVDMLSQEQEPDPEQVAAEQAEAVSRLRARASGGAFARLTQLAKANAAEEGLVEDAFYEELAAQLTKAGIELEDLPTLAQHLRQVRLRTELTPRQLSQSLRALERDVAARIEDGPADQSLRQAWDTVRQVRGLLDLKWTVEDYRQYLDGGGALLRATEWLPRLQEQAAQAGVEASWPDAASLEIALSESVRFYEIAEARDEAMARRAVAKIREDGARTAVIVAGGFHADGLRERLVRQGVSVVMLTPRVGDADERRYVGVLKLKQEAAGLTHEAFAERVQALRELTPESPAEVAVVEAEAPVAADGDLAIAELESPDSAQFVAAVEESAFPSGESTEPIAEPAVEAADTVAPTLNPAFVEPVAAESDGAVPIAVEPVVSLDAEPAPAEDSAT